jgi:hydrogenase maturation protein HypF
MTKGSRPPPPGTSGGGRAPTLPDAERHRIRVTGTVQGVGFRPFVYRHAVGLGLTGFVRNDSAGVLIEAEGDRASLSELCRIVTDMPPPLAHVESVDVAVAEELAGWSAFRIERSGSDGLPDVPVTVDAATCDECLAEVDDPGDRRYRYPFTNCTNCGPRYTIVISVPYDRPSTTMSVFEMCAACQAEYDDPASRRFHAQPNACPDCGPRVTWCDPGGRRLADGEAALGAAIQALLGGQVVAVKGIGGYHLAADATSERAVASLRRRKARDDKPFAVLVGGLEEARRLGRVSGAAAEELASARRPIVLVAKREGATLASGVAPGLPEVGLLLAYTPLHHLLSTGTARPLVMTSGNLSDDPIAHLEDDVFERLGPLVDGILTHDRPIHIRCDDSVVRGSVPAPQVMRRSRGYAPEPVGLPAPARRQVLAVGAELKSTVSVAKGTVVIPSHHIGDLEHLATYRSFLQATRHLCDLFGVRPDVVAHDLHPEYLSTKWALDCGLRPWPVQHHHAHVVSCMVEHRRTGRLLGVAFDGLGFGDDGHLWGGEFLVADVSAYERVGHLAEVTMPGGVAAIREPWRMAVAWVRAALGDEEAARVGARLDPRWPAVASLAARSTGPITTSAGRLFDAVSALVGLRARVSYEGQAAIELESLARREDRRHAPRYPVGIVEREGAIVLDPSPMVAAIGRDLDEGVEPSRVAAGFHEGLGLGAATLATELASRHGLDTVALSGGVFQNVRLAEVVVGHLEARGLEVLTHRAIPPNDGGISVGQAAVAALSGP